jgi:hypothetical protein
MKRAVILRMSMSALLLLGAAACKKKSEQAAGSEATGSAGSAASAASPAPKVDEKELARAEEPTGITWKRLDVPFGSVELPVDPGWNLVGADVQGPDGVVMVLQSQNADAVKQDRFLTAYLAMQKRDGASYVNTAMVKGSINGEPAARIEGTIDSNGTKFVTRDYLVFTKDKMVVIGARIPEASAAKLPPLLDHVVRTLQTK